MMNDICELGVFYALVAIVVFVALWFRMVSQVTYVKKHERKKKDEK